MAAVFKYQLPGLRRRFHMRYSFFNHVQLSWYVWYAGEGGGGGGCYVTCGLLWEITKSQISLIDDIWHFLSKLLFKLTSNVWWLTLNPYNGEIYCINQDTKGFFKFEIIINTLVTFPATFEYLCYMGIRPVEIF